MYITISPQKPGSLYSASVSDFFIYLKKEINRLTGLITSRRKAKHSIRNLQKELPIPKNEFSAEDLELNFHKIYRVAKSIFQSETLKK